MGHHTQYLLSLSVRVREAWRDQSVGTLRAGVIGSCGLLDIFAGNQNSVLQE